MKKHQAMKLSLRPREMGGNKEWEGGVKEEKRQMLQMAKGSSWVWRCGNC